MTGDPPTNIEIGPSEVSRLLASSQKFLFVDVRETWEYDISRIEGSVLIPLREIPANVPRLSEATQIILFCHHGMRSFDAATWLRMQGIQGARSMSGGIDRWATEVDPSVPRY
ncbi:MAG TPA: rhodanese-like domain-containing protein [Candidatus Acidoferrales bacterium]|nr:rhodanese-like domain-containing protein [Candidatus Acidoferrales bacterium]